MSESPQESSSNFVGMLSKRFFLAKNLKSQTKKFQFANYAKKTSGASLDDTDADGVIPALSRVQQILGRFLLFGFISKNLLNLNF